MIPIKSILFSFTIWVLTALLNALLGGSWLLFFSTEFKYGPEALLLVLIFTLIFSIPGIIIFWVIILMNWKKRRLFRSLLQAGFIISILSSVLLYLLPASAVNGQQVVLSFCIVVAAIASIMIHHTGIISFSANKKIEYHA